MVSAPIASALTMSAGAQSVASATVVHAVKVTILSTMLADAGIGEWGFAALVEVDGHRLLFDTGARPGTVRDNAKELGVDLSDVDEVVLSHHHDDHVGGLVTLRRSFMQTRPGALSRAHVGAGIFLARLDAKGRPENSMPAIRSEYQELGGQFVEHDGPVQLWPGVWLTGPVPRTNPERNWSGSNRIETSNGLIEDTLPEDQSLVVDTPKGLVLVSGCGHAGVVNTLEYARRQVRTAPVLAAIGGFHLFPADDAKLDWTADKLRDFGLAHLLGAHCTGIEAVYRLRQRAGLSRPTAVVAAVGSSYTLDAGIDPRDLAR